jgi:hypothetical protein
MVFGGLISLLLLSCTVSRTVIDDGTNPLSADSLLLTNGFPSLDALGRAAVQALNDSSESALQGLMVTESEFRDVIFARTPDSLKAGLPCEQAWLFNVSDSRLAIRRKLESFGGKHLRFVKTFVADTTLRYPGKTVFRNVMIVAENPGDGQQVPFRFLNVVGMVGGRCKVVAFHK